ncbi:MAG: FKBP-type peptidyl-prolyl cis-trans isomerase [Candidatus Thermoplasmatota archaeon]|nr:FKBP-type peptidyl-prolyl cis-trans isomerase [Candidatus Thermoplasmatota archaeon]
MKQINVNLYLVLLIVVFILLTNFIPGIIAIDTKNTKIQKLSFGESDINIDKDRKDTQQKLTLRTSIKNTNNLLCLNWRTIKPGDCVDLHYIGRYASNNTIFDSSYTDPTNKTGGTPLKIFVTLDPSQSPPLGYSNYSPNIIKGLMNGLIGKKAGKSYTIGPIPPEDAYGQRFGLNDIVNTTAFNQNIFNIDLSLNQTMKVIERTTDFIKMEWVDLPEDAFTMTSLIIFGSLDFEDVSPNYEDIILLCPLYSLWENSTEILSVSDEKAMIRTTPNKLTGLTENIEQIPLDLYGKDYFFIFPNETEAAYTNDSISITSSPEEGKIYHYTGQNPFGGIIHYELTVHSVTDEKIKLSILAVDLYETIIFEVNRSISFCRTFDIPIIYNMTPIFLQQALPQFLYDLEREGYGLSALAGEELIFEVEIVELHKTSSRFYQFLLMFDLLT